ncbi:MAG TPA: hypothetical protein VFF73_02830, partial [Planctomycetota bacterium]|nr:hypothetical protein [Planctomycetota bacterium]
MARSQQNQASGARPAEPREKRAPAKSRSLQVRLALLVVATTSPALLLLGFLAFYAADRAVNKVIEDRGFRMAEWLDDTFGPLDLRGDTGPLQTEIERLTKTRSGVRDII